MVHQIVGKTDGVPLFVEELTKMVLESGLVREEEGRYVGTHDGASLPPLVIPSTLQDSLMARLDRLAPVREIAQVGAVLDREFSYELLRAVSPVDELLLQQGLRQLVEAELIYQRGLPPQTSYFSPRSKVEEEAEKYFHKAIEIARKQQAKSLELRAATSLARLWQQQDKRGEAHKLLSEVYSWFTEGFDTKDLQEAKVLL
jgi:predicted ATPase